MRRIVFVEVKAGKSSLPRERLIRDAIKNRKVDWELIRSASKKELKNY